MNVCVRQIPEKSKWSISEASEFLCMNRNSVSRYADEVCTVVPDYIRDGGRVKGLNPYQFWVLVNVIKLARMVKSERNGGKIVEHVRKIVWQNKEWLSQEQYQLEVEYQQVKSKKVA